MPGSYPPSAKYSAEAECIGIYGVSEGEEQSDDIPAIWKHEVCISQQRILVQRILRRYGGQEYSGDTEVHSESAEGRSRK